MQHNMTTSERVQYERLPNGIDLCFVPTTVQDVVIGTMAFPGGVHACYDTQTIAYLRSAIMPSGTVHTKRTIVRERFDDLGARVSIGDDSEHLMVSLACRASVFLEAFELLVEVITKPRLLEKEFAEAVAHLDTELEQSRENTRAEAQTTLMRLLYAKGHPHWSPLPSEERLELTHRTRDEVARFHADTLSSVGAVVCIAGDVANESVRTLTRKFLARIPSEEPRVRACVHPEKTHLPTERDAVVTLRDKINIDTYLAIPLALTREHDDYHALSVGAAILGGSFTARLFASLRTRQSLTYGSYASLAGMGDGYAGYLRASAIFPHDVFIKGRTALRDEVAKWADKGITATELVRRKEELVGSYKVGLATTRGIAGAVFGAVLSGRGVEYVDNYPRIIETLTPREINQAIKEHIHYDLAVTAAAGSVNTDGTPLS